jgi:hypothetical protein
MAGGLETVSRVFQRALGPRWNGIEKILFCSGDNDDQ